MIHFIILTIFTAAANKLPLHYKTVLRIRNSGTIEKIKTPEQ
jgi:hypothetical protein